MKSVFHAWPYGRFIEMKINLRRKKFYRTNQGNFLGGNFSNRQCKKSQSNLEEKVKPIILKDVFSSRTDPSIFTLIAPAFLDWPNETSWIFWALKSTSHFLPQFSVPCRSDSSSEANSDCSHRSDAWYYLE